MSTITEIDSPDHFTAQTASLPPTTLLILSFHTPWAAPCAQMSLILRTLASSYPVKSPPTVSFLSINAETHPEISESYDVTAVPFLVLQRDGKVLESVSGSDATKVTDAVERHAGKGGSTAGKVTLPPVLEATPRLENGTADGFSGAGQTSSDTRVTTANGTTKVAGNSPKEDLNKRLAELVKAAPVMLFMKGTPSAPQCGFSRQLVGILREKGVRFGFFNILADEDVRQGLKEFS